MMTSSLYQALLAGFLTGLSLILPIGAQNAFVLKLGLLRQHVFIIALICALSDAVLILLGTTFVGVAFGSNSWALQALKVLGVAFLVYYGAKAFYNAYQHATTKQNADADPLNQHIPLKSAVLTCLAFTFLNPHVYLDTFLLLGSISAQYKPYHYTFAAGACLASFFWFFTLGYGARILTPLFKKSITWTILESCIGVIMWVIAYKIWVLPIH